MIEKEIPQISRTAYQVYQFPSRALLNPAKDASVLQDQEIWIEPTHIETPGEVWCVCVCVCVSVCVCVCVCVLSFSDPLHYNVDAVNTSLDRVSIVYSLPVSNTLLLFSEFIPSHLT